MKNERPCETAGCPNTLSELVPSHIRHCSCCQYLKLEKKRFINGLVQEYELFVEDKEFFSSYLDDEKKCYASVLARYLSISQETFFGYIAKGRILTVKERNRWFIPAEEAARVIALVRDWISIREAAAIAKTDWKTLVSLARQGYFGPVCRNLRGILAIKKECLPFLEAKCRELKIARRKWANRSGRHLTKGEASVSEVARCSKVSTTTIHNWISNGKLKAEKRKGWWAIKL